MLFRTRSVRRFVLFLIDIITMIVSFLLSWFIRFKDLHSWYTLDQYHDLFIMILITIFLCYTLIFLFWDGHRIPIMRQGPILKFVYVLQNQVILLGMLVLFLYLVQEGYNVSRYVVGVMFVINIFLNYLTRSLYGAWIIKVAGKGINATNIMIISTSYEVKKIIEDFEKNKDELFNISCLTILDKDMVGKSIKGIPVVGNLDNYKNTHRQNVYDEVFIRIPYSFELKLKKMINDFEDMGVTVNLNVEIFNIDSHVKKIREFGDYQVVSFAEVEHDPASLLVKRIVDVIGAIVGLVLCGIATLIVGPIIKITSPGPIFFSQTRIGINGRRFQMYKFRSMYADAEARKKELMEKNEMQGLMFKMENDPRITPIGNFIRKTSIDELPQFWNVLRGDMSIIGTRPPTVDEYEQYKNYHMRRLSIKPGITGMWQVSGRSDIQNFEEVVKLDLKYIDNWSLLMDVKILFQTVWTVIFGRGAK